MICTIKNNKTVFKKREKERKRKIYMYALWFGGFVLFFFFFGYVNSLLQHSSSLSWHAHYSSCNAWCEGLVALQHVALSSVIRDQSQIPLHWKMVSLPENHQWSPAMRYLGCCINREVISNRVIFEQRLVGKRQI